MTSNGAPSGTSTGTDTPSENLLYHVKCEVIDYHRDPSGLTRIHSIFGTYTSLPNAKAAALTSLKDAGYEPDEFTIYAEKTDPERWPYGEDVLVYAKAPNENEFHVSVDVTPNSLPGQLDVNENGEVQGDLYYVLQTQIDYYDDRIGGKQESIIEGVYRSRTEAEKAAYVVLLDEAEGVTKESYDKYETADEDRDGDWPYGEDVLVHAVGEHGENFTVEVKSKVQLKEHYKRHGTGK